MPIKNKPGFIPSSFKYQPEYYTEFFGDYAAVFTHPVKKVTIYLEIHCIGDRTAGIPLILYQSCSGRIPVSAHITRTLKTALEELRAILDDKHFSKGFAPDRRAVLRTDLNPRYLPKVTKTPVIRRKGNGRQFALDQGMRNILRGWGYPEDELPQIEEAANRGKFILDEDKAINAHQALELLGEEIFLSGLGRAAFHWTCDRYTPDNKHRISFDASILFKNN